MPLTLEQQAAQRLILGFPGFQVTPMLQRFLEAGLGGVIFFRDNFQEGALVQPPASIAHLLAKVSNLLPSSCPPPFLSLDQEGGQVERLPHTIFPSLPTPMAIAKSCSPEHLAEKAYTAMATYLAQLGFNLNYVPTLDVNLQTENPIIGVRSFGETPEAVWRFARIALEAHRRQGVLAVGKHFPGHGNGTVDSHEALPVLDFTEEELTPFLQAIEAGLPAMMVSHGFYPKLQTLAAEDQLPASASPTIIQGLLRERCGFQGLVMTDDMCMGAMTQHKDPIEAALGALSAGADLLVYKQSTEVEWAVLQAMVQALQTGRLDLQQHEQAMARILVAKQHLPLQPQQLGEAFLPASIEAISEAVAQAALSVLAGNPQSVLPLSPESSILLLHPDREALHSYLWDVATSPDLSTLFQQAGFRKLISLSYQPGRPVTLPTDLERPEVMIWVTWNPNRDSVQVEAFRQLTHRFPHAKTIRVSAGTPYGFEAFPQDLHLGLFYYRPAAMQALVKALQCPEGLAG